MLVLILHFYITILQGTKKGLHRPQNLLDFLLNISAHSFMFEKYCYLGMIYKERSEVKITHAINGCSFCYRIFS